MFPSTRTCLRNGANASNRRNDRAERQKGERNFGSFGAEQVGENINRHSEIIENCNGV